MKGSGNVAHMFRSLFVAAGISIMEHVSREEAEDLAELAGVMIWTGMLCA